MFNDIGYNRHFENMLLFEFPFLLFFLFVTLPYANVSECLEACPEGSRASCAFTNVPILIVQMIILFLLHSPSLFFDFYGFLLLHHAHTACQLKLSVQIICICVLLSVCHVNQLRKRWIITFLSSLKETMRGSTQSSHQGKQKINNPSWRD